MDRKTFIKELEFLLQDISDEERHDAISYYEDYFDEAGIENESKVIAELGDPSQVAAIIKDSIKGHFEDNISSSNQGFENTNYQRTYEVLNTQSQQNIFDKLVNKYNELSNKDKMMLIMLLVACFIPFGVVSGLLPVLLIPFFIVFGLWIITIVLFVVGISLIVAGVLQFFVTPGMGFILVGVGCIIIAFASLAEELAKWVFKDVIPKAIAWIKGIFNKGVNTSENMD